MIKICDIFATISQISAKKTINKGKNEFKMYIVGIHI